MARLRWKHGSRRSAYRRRGFTLVEVLVAVAVLGIAMAAVIKATAENGANASYLRDKTFAHWIASNKLAEMQLSGAWGDGGQDSNREFAGKTWPVHVEISEFPSGVISAQQMREVEIQVYAPGDDDNLSIDARSPLTTLHGALVNPNP